MPVIGELFALLTAICWAFGSILFSYAGRRVGAFAVNSIRIPIAALFLSCLCLLLQGYLWPPDTTAVQVVWLTLSAFLGLVIGDSCYFKSLVILGPRIGSLLAASTPIFAVIIAWVALSQKLGTLDLTGIFVTLAGLAWVTLERNKRTFGEQDGSKLLGYFLAAVGAFGQAAGLVAAKFGMGDNISSLSAAFIRMMSATVMIWALAVLRGRIGQIGRAVRDFPALKAMIAAAIVGPTFGVWMSLLSIHYTEIGIAATLMSTTPLWVIPLVMIIHHERPSVRAVFGTVVTVLGVALILLR